MTFWSRRKTNFSVTTNLNWFNFFPIYLYYFDLKSIQFGKIYSYPNQILLFSTVAKPFALPPIK